MFIQNSELITGVNQMMGGEGNGGSYLQPQQFNSYFLLQYLRKPFLHTSPWELSLPEEPWKENQQQEDLEEDKTAAAGGQLGPSYQVHRPGGEDRLETCPLYLGVPHSLQGQTRELLGYDFRSSQCR